MRRGPLELKGQVSIAKLASSLEQALQEAQKLQEGLLMVPALWLPW